MVTYVVVTEVGRAIDHAYLQVATLCRFQRCINRLRRCAVRCCGKQCEVDAAVDLVGPGIGICKHVLRIGGREVPEGFANRLAATARRHRGRELQYRMCVNQAQQFSTDVASSAEHNG
jgi:hypothetical protein